MAQELEQAWTWWPTTREQEKIRPPLMAQEQEQEQADGCGDGQRLWKTGSELVRTAAASRSVTGWAEETAVGAQPRKKQVET